MSVTQLRQEIRTMSVADRAALAAYLCELEDADGFELSPEWLDEIRRRSKEIDEGTAQLISHETLMKELRERYK